MAMLRSRRGTVLLGMVALMTARDAAAVVRVVSTTSQFSSALAAAQAGDEIHLQPGVYGGGHYRENLSQVTIRSAITASPAIVDSAPRFSLSGQWH